MPDFFYLVSADLSVHRPGFAKMICKKSGNTIEISKLETGCVDNKKTTRLNDEEYMLRCLFPTGRNTAKKTHGKMLNEISSYMVKFFPSESDECPCIFVREEALLAYKQSNVQGKTLQAISKVVGLSDAFLWRCYKKTFFEIWPNRVKKIITGDRDAEKEAVEQGLKKYIGERTYANDDESDAVAIAISWLIDNGFEIKYSG